MENLSALVDAILRSPRNRNKLVVLCEGDVLQLGDGRPPSPQMYGQLQRWPDANFYRACIPRDWHNDRLPQLWNCGGRSQALWAYETLLERHRAAPESSFLDPEKLYALVDLDIQSARLPDGYPLSTTEDIHAALYEDGLIKSDPGAEHRIWVTALVHKEAFFVLPHAADALRHGVPPFFRGAPLSLRALHAEAANSLAGDADIGARLPIVRSRLDRFRDGAGMDCTSGHTLAASWQNAAASSTAPDYDSLVRVLLAVAKIKPLWEEVVPQPGHGASLSDEAFRDQLALKIAAEIARLPPNAHPLAAFFAWLKPRR